MANLPTVTEAIVIVKEGKKAQRKGTSNPHNVLHHQFLAQTLPYCNVIAVKIKGDNNYTYVVKISICFCRIKYFHNQT